MPPILGVPLLVCLCRYARSFNTVMPAAQGSVVYVPVDKVDYYHTVASLLALDITTGKEVWKVRHASRQAGSRQAALERGGSVPRCVRVRRSTASCGMSP